MPEGADAVVQIEDTQPVAGQPALVRIVKVAAHPFPIIADAVSAVQHLQTCSQG